MSSTRIRKYIYHTYCSPEENQERYIPLPLFMIHHINNWKGPLLLLLPPSVTVGIIPIILLEILTDLVISLSSFNHTHIQIRNDKALLSPHLGNRTRDRKRDLRQTEEILRRAGSIGEDNSTGVLEAAGCDGCFEEESFTIGIVCAGFGRCVVGCPW